MEKNTRLETTSASLHIMGMVFMLLDHLWGTIVPGNDWMTCIGRLAFPIFAFMIAEGYMRTSNVKKYAKRMFIFALITEIPFNLAFGGNLLYPFHQNVLFTFLIAIGLIHLNEKARKSGKIVLRVLTAIGTVILGSFIGLITMVDYHHAGVLTVLVFYFFRERKWWGYLGQFICLWYINMEMLGGFGYEVELFGQLVFLSRQGFALLALIPIWLYRGERGHHSKGFQYFCYAFYPAHLLILGILMFVI